MVIQTPEKNYFRNNLNQVLFLELKDTFGMPIFLISLQKLDKLYNSI